MITTTCPKCNQLVAKGFTGIRPHTRYGKPCPGGLPAPTLQAAVEQTPLTMSARIVAGQAKRNAGMSARKLKRDESVRKLLPASSMDIARALGLSTDSVRVICRRIGAVIDPWPAVGHTRLWRLPAIAEAAK